MKSFFDKLSTRFPFFANRPSALERAVRQSPKSRRLRMEPLENRALLAVDAFGGAASLLDSDVGATWGPDPAPAAFSASELATDAAETTVSLAALNALPYGPYVTPEQAALIALRSNATLADETLADFNALWDETDETTLAETETDGETLSVVAEALTFESLDLGEIEQEPLPGDASVMSGSTGNSDSEGDFTLVFSGGNVVYSGGCSTNDNMNLGQKKLCLRESDGYFIFTFTGPINSTVTATVDSEHRLDFVNPEQNAFLSDGTGSFTFTAIADARYENDEAAQIVFKVDGVEVETWTATIFDAPEFISDVDNETDGKSVNIDQKYVGFSTSQLSSGPIYVPEINAQPGRGITYGGYGLSGNWNYLSPSVGGAGLCYNDNVSQGTYGRAERLFTACYTQDLELEDTVTLEVVWADVARAKSDHADEYAAFLSDHGASLSAPSERAAQLETALRSLISFDASDESGFSRANVAHAIKDVDVLFSDVLPYALKVTYCDKTTQTFALYQ